MQLNKLSAIFALFSIMACASSHAAQSPAEAATEVYARLSQGDESGFARYVPAEGYSEFNSEIGPGKLHLDMAFFHRVFAAKPKIDLRIDEMKVEQLGKIAIITGYRQGSIETPEGALTRRRPLTMVMKLDGEQWKIGYIHLSDEVAAK